MELAKSFEPSSIESKWYPLWESRGYFKPDYAAKGSPFCIQLPPPNVTGTLHMGHAFQHTLMDVLIRWHRMRGYNTLWQAGTDHAGIATQIVVEQQLKARGQDAARPRPRGVRRARVGVEGGVRRRDHRPDAPARQRSPTGRASASRWTRSCRRAVLETFVRLHEEGLIYRGKRLVNWDPQARHRGVGPRGRQRGGNGQAVGDPLSRSPTAAGSLVVATTRPETMLGDTAVAVNPDDERYSAPASARRSGCR